MSDNQVSAYLRLTYTTHTYETSVPDPDDRWSRASTSKHWMLGRVVGSESDSPDALPNAERLPFGSPVFVPYVIWNTGDSFGHDEAYDIEVLGFFSDGVAAQKALDDALQDNDIWRPWKGYFESIYSSGVHFSVIGREQ